MVLLKKLEDLQKSFLVMLSDDLEKNKLSLKEIAEKEVYFPDKWFKEKQLELNTKMTLSFFEQITKAIEGKNLSYNLTAVDSYPIEYAKPPMVPNSQKIFFKATVVGLTSVLLYLSFLLIQYLYRGPNATYQNLKAAELNVYGEFVLKLSETFSPNFESLDKNAQLLLKHLSFSLIEGKKDKNVVLISSQSPLFFISPF